MLRTPRTYVGIAVGLGAAALAALASYSHLAARTPVRPAPVATVSNAAPETFQAYTVLHGLPPRPAKRTNRHGKLHLMKVHGKYFLVGADNHYYLAGRNRQGHLVPVYHDPSTDKNYPLYYDRDRDRYYRITEDSQAHQFYRNYEGDPEDRLYEDDQGRRAGQEYAQDNGDSGDYQGSEDYQPAPEDQPDIVVADNAGHSDDWLLAIPVIAAAFLLLRPHHHHSPHFVPPTNLVVAAMSGRPRGTLPGPRPHVANPPIFVRPPVVPMANGKPSIPNPGVLTHRWMPPGSTPIAPPPTVVATHRAVPPARPPLFQHSAHQAVSIPGGLAVTSRHHPVPAIHTASSHFAPSVVHDAVPVFGRRSSLSARPAVHAPASETRRQTASLPYHEAKPAGETGERRVPAVRESHYTPTTAHATHTPTAAQARSETVAPVAAARTAYSPPRPEITEHAQAKPAAISPADRETSSASPSRNRPQAPQESTKPAKPEAAPARPSSPPPAPAHEEARPSSPPRPAAHEEARPPQPASPPPVSHSAPAEQPHSSPLEPPRSAPAEPPRAAPAEPPHHAAPAPEPSHNNENHGNDNNSGGNNGGKKK